MSCGDLFLGLLAVLFPPIAGPSLILTSILPSLSHSLPLLTCSGIVWIKSGLCTADSLLNILLCMLGYLPGLLHAWYIIAKNPEREYDYEVIPDSEQQGGRGNQRVTYYYVRHEQGGSGRGYGTQQGGQGQGYSRPAMPKPQANTGSSRPTPAQNNASGTADGPSVGAGGDEPGAPPSYSEVVRGDHKIQSQD
jgi:uncharacterized membrane protein YqaE (UPF0057 family)